MFSLYLTSEVKGGLAKPEGWAHDSTRWMVVGGGCSEGSQETLAMGSASPSSHQDF